MESSVVVDGNGGCGGRVVVELSHIKDLVRQLEGHLGGSQAQERCRLLASQISSLTDRSIGLITSYGGRKWPAAAPSPLSDATDAPFKRTKKRRTTEKVKHQVRAAAGGDVPADDGHSWRKYGQKEILGAKHPRGYYRCTHRHTQGCAATKQVQRADEDPALFNVVYIGAHTCVQSGAAAGQAAAAAQAPDHNLVQSLSASLTVKTEGLAAAPEEAPHGWFAAAPSTSENWGTSPATSDSNKQHASFPPFDLAAGDVQFEFGEVVSALVDVHPGEFHDDFDISSFFA